MAPLTEADRAAALARGPQMVSRRTIAIFVASLLALGAGGVLGDHFFTGPSGSTTSTTTSSAYPPALPSASGPTSGASGAQLPSSMSSLMGLSRTRPITAPAVSLTDQRGSQISLSRFKGSVVILSFFDAACDDICPVLTTELVGAFQDLGRDASRVVVLTVNTDPLSLAPSAASSVLQSSGIGLLDNWHFLTGSLRQLESVWTAYGIAVDADPVTNKVSHNDALYFVDPSGRVRLRATPYADENPAGTFTLPVGTESEWSKGIAKESLALLEVHR